MDEKSRQETVAAEIKLSTGNRKKANVDNSLHGNTTKEEVVQSSGPQEYEKSVQMDLCERKNTDSRNNTGVDKISSTVSTLLEEKAVVYVERKEMASHPHKRKLSSGLKVVAAVLALLVITFFFVHFWTDGSCTEDSFCKLCGKIRTTAPGHQWNNATCTNAKYCEECGETEGTPLAHNWKAATCTELKTCRDCGKTEGTVLEHDWQAATCTQPATCVRCGLTTGTNSHTWTENSTDVLKKCSLCMKQVEFFHNPLDGELLAWTEYEMINNRPANPVTYVVHDEEWVDWALIREGDIEISRSDKLRLLYVNDKIYYYVLRYCEIDDDIAYNLAITGRRYVNATRYMWETNKEFLHVDLTVDDPELIWGRTIGSAYAVFDADGSQYVIVRIYDSDKVYAVRSNWKN